MQFSRYVMTDLSVGPLAPQAPLRCKGAGSHLFSHTVSSIVSSAGRVLTIVFGMRTGVPPGRIATGNL